MKNTTKIILGAIIVLIFGIVIGYATHSSSVKVGSIGPSDSSNFTAIGLGTNSSYSVVFGNRVPMTPSSIVPCSIQTPNATSSLSFVSFELSSVTVATTTKWYIANATTATATTTNIYTSAQLAASSGLDYANSFETTYLPPLTYINVGVVSSSTAQLANVTGACSAQFTVIQ